MTITIPDIYLVILCSAIAFFFGMLLSVLLTPDEYKYAKSKRPDKEDIEYIAKYFGYEISKHRIREIFNLWERIKEIGK